MFDISHLELYKHIVLYANHLTSKEYTLRCSVLQVQHNLLGNIVEFSAKSLQGPQEIVSQRLSSMNGAFVDPVVDSTIFLHRSTNTELGPTSKGKVCLMKLFQADLRRSSCDDKSRAIFVIGLGLSLWLIPSASMAPAEAWGTQQSAKL